MLSDGFDPIDTTYTALISAHGKNGDLDSALRTYEEMVSPPLSLFLPLGCTSNCLEIA